ncbi:hypothetical protein EC973_009071 [Apophysomyces ossiformis]|uniref:RNA polymerase II elongation factor ELL N-terminal domain-containing protein n=1 Tax=Apophysomyces ossiformis TaxID=679940 RepID=A0A8H7BM37_9FUNG|nr:hypothetical protein EC973_009071 [Apophysomyces ossiformis]
MPPQRKAIALRLNREALNLLNESRHDDSIQIKFDLGSSSAIRIGDKIFPVTMHDELSSAVYVGGHGNQISFVSNVTHNARMKQVLSLEDKARIRDRTAAAEREKRARHIELLDIVNTPTTTPPKRPNVKASRPSPFASSSQPNPPARLEPSPTINSTLRERMIHLLAIRPCPIGQLTTMLKATAADLLPLLKKVAICAKNSDNHWYLRPEIYKEIRIWEWSRYDDKERALVIENTKEAYDRLLKLSPNAPERANLIPRKPKPQTLVPPPSQTRRSSSQEGTSKDREGGSGNSKKRNEGREEEKQSNEPKKAKKTEGKSRKTTSKMDKIRREAERSSVAHATPPLNPIPASPIQSPPAPADPPQPPPPPKPRKATPPPPPPESEEESESDEEVRTPYSVSHIDSQKSFERMIKTHQNALKHYIQCKQDIHQNYPLYVEALLKTEIEDGSPSDKKARFLRKMGEYYQKRGGDVLKWRRAVRLTRRFNWLHDKVDAIWKELELACATQQFTIPPQKKKKR